jgi:hypothetical protein
MESFIRQGAVFQEFPHFFLLNFPSIAVTVYGMARVNSWAVFALTPQTLSGKVCRKLAWAHPKTAVFR